MWIASRFYLEQSNFFYAICSWTFQTSYPSDYNNPQVLSFPYSQLLATKETFRFVESTIFILESNDFQTDNVLQNNFQHFVLFTLLVKSRKHQETKNKMKIWLFITLWRRSRLFSSLCIYKGSFSLLYPTIYE